MECRVVGTEDTTVKVGIVRVFLFDGTDVGILDNLNSQYVCTLDDGVSHIVHTTDKGTLNAAEFLAVEVDVGLPVDAVEVEEQTLTLKALGQSELVAIPEVRVEERLRNLENVVGIVGVGYGTGILVAGENGARYGGYDPALVVKVGCSNSLARSLNLRRALYAPVTARKGIFLTLCCGLSLGLGRKTSTTHNLNLAEHVLLAVCRLLHKHAHVASLALAGYFIGQTVGRGE